MKNEYEQYALARKVLAVAVIKYEEDGNLFDWAVYVDAVEGKNHDNEYMAVAYTGAKLIKEFAVILFPSYDQDKYRR